MSEPSQISVWLGYAIATITALLLIPRLRFPRPPSPNDKGIVDLPYTIYLGAPGFFYQPCEYIAKARALTGGWFRFYIRGRRIVVPHDASSKSFVLNSKAFSLTQGYANLAPGASWVAPTNQNDKHSIANLLRRFLTPEVIQSQTLYLMKCMHSRIAMWGDSGKIDIFFEYKTMFDHLFVDIAFGADRADDPHFVKKITASLDALVHMTEPKELILPLIPTPSRLRALLGGIFSFRSIHKLRSAWQIRLPDSARHSVLRHLMDDDTELKTCVTHTAATLFAFQTLPNIAAWLQIMLIQHPIWLHRVLDEITTFNKLHSLSSTEGLNDYIAALASLPVEQFEKNLETMDICIDETIRLVHNTVLSRRNIGPDVVLDGHLVKSGDFVFVTITDAHRDPDVYEEPEQFKPGRNYSKNSVSYLGWGYGRHLCPGQRFGRIAIKMVVMSMLSHFDYAVIGQDDTVIPVGIIPPQERSIFLPGDSPTTRLEYTRK